MQSLSTPNTLLAISYLERALKLVNETPLDDYEALKEIDQDLIEAYKLINAAPHGLHERSMWYFVPAVSSNCPKTSYTVSKNHIDQVKRNVQSLVTDLKNKSRIKLPTFC